MIYEYLSTGERNAKTARELCDLLHLEKRELTAAIERERRQGSPICASCDRTNPGYYLASSKEEMQRYCNSLARRAKEINRTKKACLETIEKLPKED